MTQYSIGVFQKDLKVVLLEIKAVLDSLELDILLGKVAGELIIWVLHTFFNCLDALLESILEERDGCSNLVIFFFFRADRLNDEDIVVVLALGEPALKLAEEPDSSLGGLDVLDSEGIVEGIWHDCDDHVQHSHLRDESCYDKDSDDDLQIKRVLKVPLIHRDSEFAQRNQVLLVQDCPKQVSEGVIVLPVQVNEYRGESACKQGDEIEVREELYVYDRPVDQVDKEASILENPQIVARVEDEEETCGRCQQSKAIEG